MVNPRYGADASSNKTNEILTVYLLNLLKTDQDKLTIGTVQLRVRSGE